MQAFRPVGYREILHWVCRGKTITRGFMNGWLKANPQVLTGTVLDLGGAGDPSYKPLLPLQGGSYKSVDMRTDVKADYVANIEEPLPIPDASADWVLLLNTLEHIFNYQQLVSEMQRVAAPGGKALVFVPFMLGVHTYKGEDFFINDYFRYTASALERCFLGAGWKDVRVQPVGGLFWVIADLLMVAARFKPVRVAIAAVCGALEKIVSRAENFDSAGRYPLGYFVTATK